MPPPSLRYAITDRHLLAPHQRADAAPLHQPDAGLEPARSGGEGVGPAPSTLPTRLLLDQAILLRRHSIDFLQIREKDLPLPELLALLQALRAAIPPGSPPRLLLNLGHATLSPDDLLELALTSRLDGVHLPSTLTPAFATHARSRFAAAGLPPPTLSASVHSPAEIAAYLPASPDLLLFGPVFGKSVHGAAVTSPLGLAALAEAVQRAHPTPVLALGGLTPANTAATLATGAAGIASIRLFLPGHAPAQPLPAHPGP